MPKKSRSIKLDDESSLFCLKAVISREKEKIKSGEHRKQYEIKRPQQRNVGVEERAKKDES